MIEVTETQEELFAEFWRGYTGDNRTAVTPKPQTTLQLIGECLSLGLGIRKGSVKARRAEAVERFPELFQGVECLK